MIAVRITFQFPKAATDTVKVKLDQIAWSARRQREAEEQAPFTNVVNGVLLQDPL